MANRRIVAKKLSYIDKSYNCQRCRMVRARLVDGSMARDIAVEFLRQCHDVIKTEVPMLSGNHWYVEVVLSSSLQRRVEVLVNSRTGYVDGFTVKPTDRGSIATVSRL